MGKKRKRTDNKLKNNKKQKLNPKKNDNGDISLLPDANLKEIVKVDFDFFSLLNQDYFPIKQQLRPLLDNTQYNVEDLVQYLIDDPFLGTVIRQGNAGQQTTVKKNDKKKKKTNKDNDKKKTNKDNDDNKEKDDGDNIDVGTSACITCFNIAQDNDAVFIKQIINFILRKNIKKKDKVSDDGEFIDLVGKKIEGSKPLGLMIVSRWINLPAQLLLPLYRCFFADLENAQKDVEKGKDYKFKDFLVITNSYIDKKNDVKGAQLKDFMFDWIDEEYITHNASHSIRFRSKEQKEDNLTKYIHINLISLKELVTVFEDLKNILECPNF